MGIGDYIWPFQRKFQDIPCAREAGLAAFLGGPATGALIFVTTGRPKASFFGTTYSGFAYFWITLFICRYQYARSKLLSEKFKEAVDTNKLD